MRHERSTFAQNASSQITRAASSGPPGQLPVEAEGARQEVHAEVEPGAGVEQVLHLLVRLVPGDRRVQLQGDQVRGAQPDPAGQLAHDHLGDQHPQSLAGTAELAHVGAQVVGLDQPGQAAALAQRGDVARDADGPDHPSGASPVEPLALRRHVEVRPRPLRVEPVEVVVEQPADREVAVPLLVARDHEPGRVVGVGPLQGDLVGPLVLRPHPPLVDVTGVVLPVLARVVQPGQQPLLLRLRRDVQHALDQDGAGLDELPLELVDRGVASLDLLGGRELAHPGDQHVLVVRAVEDPDVAGLGQGPADPPQEVVAQLRLRRRLERGDPHALGVHQPDGVAQHAALAGGVHALQDQQQATGRAGARPRRRAAPAGRSARCRGRTTRPCPSSSRRRSRARRRSRSRRGRPDRPAAGTGTARPTRGGACSCPCSRGHHGVRRDSSAASSSRTTAKESPDG